jgi:hypothetical protein
MPRTRPLDILGTQFVPVHRFADQAFCEMKLDIELRHPHVLDSIRGTVADTSRETSREDGRSFHAAAAEGAAPASPEVFRELLRSRRPFILLESPFQGTYKDLRFAGRPDAVRFDGDGGAQVIDYKVRFVPRIHPSDIAQLHVYGLLVARRASIPGDRIHLTTCVIDRASAQRFTELTPKARIKMVHAICQRRPLRLDGVALRTRTAPYDEKRATTFLANSIDYWLGRRAPLPTANPARCRSCLVNAVGQCPVAKAAPVALMKPFTMTSGTILISNRSESQTDSSPIHAMHGMGGPVADLLVEGGIDSLEKLAEASAEQVARLIKWNPKSARTLSLRARACLENRPIPVMPFQMPRLPRVYFDIETDDWGGKECIWAVTVLDERTGQLHQWHLQRLTDQLKLLRTVARCLSRIGPGHLVAYSGSHFDERLLVHHLHQQRIRIPNCLKYVADVCWDVWRSVALPGSYGLKEILRTFGIPHSMAHLDGREAAAEAMSALRAGVAIPQELLAYNREDVKTLPLLLRAVEALTGAAPRKLQLLRNVAGA